MKNPTFRKFVNDIGTQADVAKMLKLSPGHVSLLFNGKRRVTLDIAEQIDIATNGKYPREQMVFPRRRSS